MSSNTNQLFHPLQPGTSLEGDWCNFPIPLNMEVGENTVIDSSSCFKKFFSKLRVGLKLGKNITLQSPALATEANAYIEIGDFSFISGAAIIASHKVIVGKHVFIAGGVTIVDSDFHPLDAAARITDTIAISTVGNKSLRPQFDAAPVVIEDDVWIGFNATILKGVTIGRGSVIQPGAVVLKNVPAGAIVSGNPAQIEMLEHA
ncbi:MAG: acyltransferase [Segetibacter sp.]|nr:acyltransferase [Segetibacter sp.]